MLGGRERVAACELLLLRARADLDAAREREAALQLRVGLEALLAERRGARGGGTGARTSAALDERATDHRRAGQRGASGRALRRADAELTETLRLCERVLRRRRALGCIGRYL